MKTPTSISLPQGVRDILPEEARKYAVIESAFMSVFEQYGFGRVITPLLEYVDVLLLGMDHDLADSMVKFIDPGTGRLTAVRPDITPQIARVVATRMRGRPRPLKLCYSESVVRNLNAGSAKAQEILQIGAELLTDKPGAEADAEMISIAIEALRGAGLEGFKVDVGDVGFVRAIFNRIGLTEKERKPVKDAIAAKDGSALERALDNVRGDVSREDRELLGSLTTLYGDREVLNRAESLAVCEETAASFDNLKRVLALLNDKGLDEYVTIDLGEVRGFDYYTGIIFEVFTHGVGKPLLSGGRYDKLLERYGYPCASIGFAFDVGNVVAALEGE